MPVPLIAGITGSALIVLLVAFFVVLLKCRKGKERSDTEEICTSCSLRASTHYREQPKWPSTVTNANSLLIVLKQCSFLL